LPLQTGAAGPFPILPVGWTLSFEFVFYGLFAASLALPRRVLPVLLALAFGLFHWVGPYAATAPLRWFFGSLLWWEFWLGVLLGLGFAKGWRPVRALSIGLLILGAGAGLSSLFPQCAGLPDLWTRGFPAALFLAGVCGLESRVQDVRLPRLGLAMGDASYALYLWHPLWIGGPLAFLFKGGVLGMPLALALCIVLPWIFALAFFRFVEAPWLRILRGK
ncbi:MAG: hypothetical protein RL318_1817, partial [Fibrobacterota bacterium]